MFKVSIPNTKGFNSLEKAVIISLMSFKRGKLADDKYKHGYWGDEFSNRQNDELGSNLWQVMNGKLSNATRNMVNQYIQDALKWMVEDSLANSIDVETNIHKDMLEVIIFIDNKQTIKFNSNIA